jgi:3-oxoacyl-[acyl-carrier-protein] synthase-3
MTRAAGVVIAGLGHAVPDRVVTSAELEQRLSLEPGWIEQRTGIRSRRWARDGELLSDLATSAGAAALDAAGLSRRDVGLLMLATSTPDHLLPPSGPRVAHALGLDRSGAIDVTGACAGFVYALVFADAHVRATGRPVLVIAANILSRRIAPNDRSTAIMFADAAGAVLLAPSRDGTRGIVGQALASDGRGYALVHIPAGGSAQPFTPDLPPDAARMRMPDGKALFSGASKLMAQCGLAALADAGLTAADVDRLVPHQANARMLDVVARQLAVPPDKVVRSITEFGNSSAATIPLSLSIDAAHRPLQPDEVLLMCAAGAGLTAGGAVWRV